MDKALVLARRVGVFALSAVAVAAFAGPPKDAIVFSNDGFIEGGWHNNKNQDSWHFVQNGINRNLTQARIKGRPAIKAKNIEGKKDPDGRYHQTVRALLKHNKKPIAMPGDKVWVGFSILIPSSGGGGVGRFVHQVHQSGERKWIADAANIQINPQWDTITFRTRPSNFGKGTSVKILNKVAKDKWINFAIKYRLSFNNTGFVEVWVDGVKKADIKGVQTLFNEPKLKNIHFSFENYSFFKKHHGTGESSINYISSVKIANESAMPNKNWRYYCSLVSAVPCK